MGSESRWMGLLHRWLRPAFGLGLFLSQFTSRRGSLVTENPWLLVLGVSVLAGGVWLLALASVHLQRARQSGVIAMTGPYRRVRHPIYASIYLLSAGLGLVFSAWVSFVAMAAFAPLWWLEGRSEEATMLSEHGDSYRAYQENTSMFLPGVL